MQRRKRFALWGGLLLSFVVQVQASCFEYPPNTDYASVLTPVVTGNKTDVSSAVPKLTDHLGDPKSGSRFAMEETTIISYVIPWSLPRLATVILRGSGWFQLDLLGYIDDKWSTQKVIELADKNNGTQRTVASKDGMYATLVNISVYNNNNGQIGEVYLTDIQFMGSSEPAQVPSPPEYSELTVTPLPCVCNGEGIAGKGQRCGVWDKDCNTTGGWCYVEANAGCADMQKSSHAEDTLCLLRPRNQSHHQSHLHHLLWEQYLQLRNE
eukprot:TRINITY_DN800_c0_g1_i1.p1 TRINITY_DN800_c0_g1~~TRINITY_DN800_c0_g1_i1.p1  ORF type:complete len:279 (-),score=40.63 TRINITY_DN800_c0_g1_i1:279-1079(-)